MTPTTGSAKRAPSAANVPRELESERGRWEQLARDPYYAVVNDETNRGARLNGEARKRFIEIR